MRFGIWELLVILLIVVVLFGTKRIRSIGSDLGDAIKSFRSAVREDKSEKPDAANDEGRVIEGQVQSKTESERSKESV
ncbi:MAG: twin-arginine translocase TatA/TatE family subunit [Gammaproteobacteria bacterium]|nr:twin-arginine translocase TatA/TatE family subunit [Gammaproteobacteria bacterium]